MLKLLYPHYWIYYDMAEEEGGSDTDMGDTDTLVKLIANSLNKDLLGMKTEQYP